MSTSDLINNLDKLDIPDIELCPSHQRRLRLALASTHENRSRARRFGYFIIDIFSIMPTKKKLFSAGLGAAAIVLALSFAYTPIDTVQAQAVDIINRAYGRLAQLTPEQREELRVKFEDRAGFNPADLSEEERAKLKAEFREFKGMGHAPFSQMSAEDREAMKEQMKVSLEGSLEEALAAPDLEYIGGDEFLAQGHFRFNRIFGQWGKNEDKDQMHWQTEDGMPKEIPQELLQYKPVKFLKYTDPEGRVVILGVNANDEPVVKHFQGSHMPGMFGRPMMPMMEEVEQ